MTLTDTKTNFYRTKQFIKLQNEWYKKLKQSGFEDLEWYNPKRGSGQNSDYLKNTIQFDPNTFFDLVNLSINRQKYLAAGPFYPNLKHLYDNSDQLQQKFKYFKHFTASLPVYHDQDATKLWQLWCDGVSMNKISLELRKLYRRNRMLKRPNKANPTREPYSDFWVHSELKRLDRLCLLWNHQQDIDAESEQPIKPEEDSITFVGLDSDSFVELAGEREACELEWLRDNKDYLDD